MVSEVAVDFEKLKVVHDKFHISKHIGETVDKVRKTENRTLVKQGEKSLKGIKYLWLTNLDNWTEKQKGLFKSLKDKGLKVTINLHIVATLYFIKKILMIENNQNVTF